jgi:hypothetical protein
VALAKALRAHAPHEKELPAAGLPDGGRAIVVSGEGRRVLQNGRDAADGRRGPDPVAVQQRLLEGEVQAVSKTSFFFERQGAPLSFFSRRRRLFVSPLTLKTATPVFPSC